MHYKLESMIPVLAVQDLAETINFYTKLLGCTVLWQTPGIASLDLQGREFMISTLETHGPGTLWLGVDEILDLYEPLREAGVPCILEPTNMNFAHHMRFLDPSGNILWFGSSPLSEGP
jgi:catechol 2,3-dioxygenase-like lactoylglutathione lyase family enzyme